MNNNNVIANNIDGHIILAPGYTSTTTTNMLDVSSGGVGVGAPIYSDSAPNKLQLNGPIYFGTANNTQLKINGNALEAYTGGGIKSLVSNGELVAFGSSGTNLIHNNGSKINGIGMTNNYVTSSGYWVATNNAPPTSAQSQGQAFFWNSNATVYLLTTTPNGTAWAATNKIGGP